MPEMYRNLPVTVEIYDPSKEAQKPQFELSEYLVYTSVGKAVDHGPMFSRSLWEGLNL